MTIHLLDDLTINQMAAGEVIENTSSVIKELVENALDAHATSIEVEVHTGGRSYIRVSDNGDGILHDEVPKAIVRHATSKLRSYTDLHALTTLGFRGEALASIASISKFSITTATRSATSNQPNGTFFVAVGGKTVTHVPIFREKGTTVEVKELFFNTPVRKSFQRSATYDTQEILKRLTHLSLGYPEVAIRLIADGKVLLNLYPSDLQERAASLIGKKTTPLSYQQDGIFISGVVCDPHDHRNNKAGQYLLVNRRSLHSSLIAAAVKEGYGHSLPDGRFPQFVLHVEMEPSNVDVNVHPQKREVRFQSQSLTQTLTRAVQAALFKQEAPKETFAKMVWSAREPTPVAPPPVLFAEEPSTKILYILPGYLIIDQEGLRIVNTTKAFEYLFKMKDLPTFASVGLLIPYEMENHLAFEEIEPLLKSLGIEASPFSEKKLLIHSQPPGMTESEVIDLVREIFSNWQEDLPISKLGRLSHRFNKKKLTQQEALYLIQKLEKHPVQKGITTQITKDLLDKCNF